MNRKHAKQDIKLGQKTIGTCGDCDAGYHCWIRLGVVESYRPGSPYGEHGDNFGCIEWSLDNNSQKARGE